MEIFCEIICLMIGIPQWYVLTTRYNTVLLSNFSTASDFTWNQFRWMLKSTKSVILKAEDLHFVFRFVQKYPKIFTLCTKTWRITFLVMWRAIMSKSSYYQSIFENDDDDRDRGKAQCGNFVIFLPFIFSVESILREFSITFYCHVDSFCFLKFMPWKRWSIS